MARGIGMSMLILTTIRIRMSIAIQTTTHTHTNTHITIIIITPITSMIIRIHITTCRRATSRWGRSPARGDVDANDHGRDRRDDDDRDVRVRVSVGGGLNGYAHANADGRENEHAHANPPRHVNERSREGAPRRANVSGVCGRGYDHDANELLPKYSRGYASARVRAAHESFPFCATADIAAPRRSTQSKALKPLRVPSTSSPA